MPSSDPGPALLPAQASRADSRRHSTDVCWERRTNVGVPARGKRYSELVVFQEGQPWTFRLFVLGLGLVRLGSRGVESGGRGGRLFPLMAGYRSLVQLVGRVRLRTVRIGCQDVNVKNRPAMSEGDLRRQKLGKPTRFFVPRHVIHAMTIQRNPRLPPLPQIPLNLPPPSPRRRPILPLGLSRACRRRR